MKQVKELVITIICFYIPFVNQHYNPVQNQSKKSNYLLQSSTLEFRSVSWIECLLGPSGFLMPIGHFHGHIPIKDFRFVHPRCSEFAMALLEACFFLQQTSRKLEC